MPTQPQHRRPAGFLDSRQQTGRALVIAGVVGLVGSLVAALIGLVLVDRARESITVTVDPVIRVVDDVTESIEASRVIVERTTDAIESIETATRSTVRTMVSVGDVLDETADLAGGGVADSLESAVGSLPGLVSTGRVLDRTMRALNLLGVDYDPEIPLDVALADLETSLAPIPDQIRDQVELIGSVGEDLDVIADDARALSAVLFESRLDMIDADRALSSALRNAESAVESLETVRTDVGSYTALARVLVIAAAIALTTAALAPLLLGLHLRRGDNDHFAVDQAAT